MSQNPSALTPHYRSLTRNIVLLVIFISFTPMVLVTGIILRQFSASHHEKIHAHLEELVLKHQQNIDSFLEEKVMDIRFLADAIDFDTIGEKNATGDHLYRLQSAFGTVFVDLGVVDEQGQQVAYAGPFKLEKARYEEADWFKRAINNPYFISDVFLGLRRSPHFIIAVRKNWEGQKWIIRATIDFLSFNRLVENVRIGETGFAYILNREGQFQTHPSFDFTPTLDIYTNYFDTLEREGKTGLADAYIFHKAVEREKIDGGPDDPFSTFQVFAHGNDKVRRTPEPQKHIADKIRIFNGPLEPVGLFVARFYQFERPGVGHLLTLFVHHAKVDKHGAEGALQVVKVDAGRVLFTDGVEVDGIGQKADVHDLLFKKTVDVLLMFENQFLQMGMDFFMVGCAELSEDNPGDQNHGRKGDKYDQQYDVACEGPIVRRQWSWILGHTRSRR